MGKNCLRRVYFLPSWALSRKKCITFFVRRVLWGSFGGSAKRFLLPPNSYLIVEIQSIAFKNLNTGTPTATLVYCKAIGDEHESDLN